MIVPYVAMPASADAHPRPLLRVGVADSDDVRVWCLVDSGSIHTLLPRWLARIGGIPLEDAEVRHLAVAGTGVMAAFTTCRLAAANHAWEAEVGFAEPWPYEWGLLGHEAFFRYFEVTFRAVDLEFELLPVG